MDIIQVGNRKIGLGQPAYVVAEIGINHNGDMELARKTILAAKEAGADAVKFQNYKTEDFIPTQHITYQYISQGKIVEESQHAMFKRYELKDEALVGLKQFCDSLNIDFHSTPTSTQGIDFLTKIGVGVLKNGSDYLTNLELIRAMGETGLPTVLSTGMAFEDEIDDAVSAFRATGNHQLILLHCTSQYPTPAQDTHIRKMPTLRARFHCLVGFSDHTEGPWAACAAVTLGAHWIEKHFTLDINLPGPDHRFSCNPKEFQNMVEGIRWTEGMLGQSVIEPTETEKMSRNSFRLSCCAAKDFIVGHTLACEDIHYYRPGSGIAPKHKALLLSRKLKKDVKQGHVFNLEDVE